MHQNGSERSKTSGRGKAKAKERVKGKGRQSREIEKRNLLARTSRPETATANGQPTATLPTMDLKVESVEAII
jgi:hypothetical protein